MHSQPIFTVTCKPPTRFPAYLLDHVFIYLSLPDLYHCQRVCREWHAAISYFPLLKPILFTAPPRSGPYPPVPVTEIQIHPVFSAIEQDWSIILSATVLSRSNSAQPMFLEDYAVRNNMATYPALKKVMVYVGIDGLHAQSSRGNGDALNGDKCWKFIIDNETGVRVGDIWDKFMNFVTNTKGIAEEDRSLRETFMTGDYHSFTWGLQPVDPDSASIEDSTSHWLLKKTFHGAVYRGWFDRRITAERESQLLLERPRLTSRTGCSQETLKVASDPCTPKPVASKRRRSWRKWAADAGRRYEGEYDLSF